MIGIIAALGHNGEIGLSGALPWPTNLTADMKHFRNITMGDTVVMGRATYESIGRPLPGRRNIVVTSHPMSAQADVEIVSDLEQFLRGAENSSDFVWVIGGSDVYRAALPYARRMELTQVDAVFEADRFFPPVAWTEWHMTHTEFGGLVAGQRFGLCYQTWDRQAAPGSPLYLLDNFREPEQLAEMVELTERNHCFMCHIHEDREVLIRGQYWNVFHNEFPYKHTKQHFLLVPRAHHLTLDTMMAGEHAEYGLLLTTIMKQYQLTGCSTFMRIGEMRLTGATVAHIHGHLIAGDVDDPDFEPVKVKLAGK